MAVRSCDLDLPDGRNRKMTPGPRTFEPEDVESTDRVTKSRNAGVNSTFENADQTFLNPD
jgi:hypothetical protein